MDNLDNTQIRKLALESALSETHRLIYLFADVLRGKEIGECPTVDFSQTAMQIMGLAKKSADVSETKTETKSESKNISEDNLFVDMDLEQLKTCVMSCTACKLASTRTNVVFGEGYADSPDIMIIGEGPGQTEDETGRPFTGKAGQYLDTWLKPISSSRQTNVYIANIVKCRPPQNRDPERDEKQACFGYLKQQIKLVNPKSILCLGRPASMLITNRENMAMRELRGKFYFYESSIPVMCTYHPAAVLRDPSLKRDVWEDLQKLARYLDLKIVR